MKMKQRKNKRNLLVVCALLLMLVGCIGGKENPETSETEEIAEATPRVYLSYIEYVQQDTSVTTADGKTLSLAADETYTPVSVSKEQMEERIAELKEKYPEFADSDLAALLVANASYMEPEVFAEYVETYFGDSYHLMMECEDYQLYKYNRAMENAKKFYEYGNYDSLIRLDELYFDEYLIAQAVVMEEHIDRSIASTVNMVEDFDNFMFLYDYMRYEKVDELIFMRGDARVEGTGLVFQEYVVDVFIARYLYLYYGNPDMEQPELDIYKESQERSVYGEIDTQSNRRYIFQVSSERLLLDEIENVLSKIKETETEEGSDN